MTFFDKLLNGEDVLAPVIQYITDEECETQISDIVDVEHTAQQHTRKRKTQAKDDNVVIETNTNDDNNSIEINDEENKTQMITMKKWIMQYLKRGKDVQLKLRGYHQQENPG
jgi:hypothetical protein